MIDTLRSLLLDYGQTESAEQKEEVEEKNLGPVWC